MLTKKKKTIKIAAKGYWPLERHRKGVIDRLIEF